MKKLLQNLVSIKNEKEHKVFNIFGVKLKVFNTKTIQRRLDLIHRQMLRITPRANIEMLEIHITEHCNLNCQTCAHFSSLAEPEFASLDDFERDVKRMAELTLGKIDKIHILGGEPLLHPDCTKFLEITRKYFPESCIRLITNGILLPQQTADFYKILAQNNIVIEPTKYPIKIDWEKVQRDCDEYGVKLEFYTNTGKEIKTTYSLPMDLEGKQNPRTSFLNCVHANACTQLVNGKLYTCCFPCYIRHFNKYFNQSLETSELDCIDIYKAKDINEILTFLAKPIPFCRYCKTKARKYNIPWKTTAKKIEEWL